MLDIKIIRNDPNVVEEIIQMKKEKGKIQEILALDKERRALLVDVEELKHKKNEASEKIGAMKQKGEDASKLIQEMKELGDSIKKADDRVNQIEKDLERLMLWIPNLPDSDVPRGDETANKVVRIFGTPRSFNFSAKPHWDIGKDLGILDIEGGARLAGSGFIMLTSTGARLERALINFMMDLHVDEHGYTEVSPPYMANRTTMTGTGQVPKMENDMYLLEKDDLFLIPTAEVPLANFPGNRILDEEELPISLVGRTPCFRREAGAAGKDTRGLLRLHQFMKVELVKITKEEDSAKALETMVNNAERVLQLLGLHYRVVLLAVGDLGFASAKTYDLEIWAPGVQKWLEVSSCSNCRDFQARRIGIRYKKRGIKEEKPKFAHTLNASGVALPRLVATVLENGQEKDGRIRLPEVLWPYMNGMKEILPVVSKAN